ncbi:MAG: guanylate kinase [Odoribacter sp.]|nr:guanylate kinase [Odoribacter sp.]
MKGKLIIISAPSGAGKTTIVKHLLNSDLNLEFSVSATSRSPRPGERDGEDYYFFSMEKFRNKVRNNEFVEWEEVYKDHLYGTLNSEIERIWNKGCHVIFDVDARGGINLKNKFGNLAVALFIMPPSVPELEMRLINRGKDSPEIIKMRVEKAATEMKLSNQFDFVVVNRELDRALAEAVAIVSSFLAK